MMCPRQGCGMVYLSRAPMGDSCQRQVRKDDLGKRKFWEQKVPYQSQRWG